MAFFLKSSKLTFILNKFYRESKIFNLENKVFPLKKISSLNTSTIQRISLESESGTTQTSITETETKNKINFIKIIRELEQESNNNYFLSLSNFDEALKFIETEENTTIVEANLLIRSCGSYKFSATPEEKTKVAEKIVSILEEKGTKLNISHYNNLLSVYLQNNHSVSLNEFLNSLTQKGIKPNYLTYQRLLKIFCYQGNIHAASEILEILKKEDLPINKNIFNSLIYGHGQIKDIEGAYDILNIMEKKGLEPDFETYANLICAYATVGDIEKIYSTFETCEKKEIIFSDEDLLHIIFVLAKNGQKECINNILPKLKKGFGYNTTAKNYIFRLFENNCDSTGLSIFNTLQVNDHFKKNHGKFLINYFIKNRSPNEILNICKILDNKKFEYSALSYGVEKISRDKNDKLLLSILELFKRRNITLSPEYFWPALINASKISNKNLLEVVKVMVNLEIHPDFLTIHKIICPNYVFGNDLEADLETFQNAGVRVDVVSEFLLIKFLNADNFDDAVKIAHTAPIFLRKNVINALKRVSDPDLLVELLHSLLHNFSHEGNSVESSESTTDSGIEDVQKLSQETTNNRINPKMFAGLTLKNWVLTNDVNEAALVKVLKKMLEKGIKLPLDTADFIRTRCNSDEMNALLNKLTDNNLKMLLNDEILAVKNKYPVFISEGTRNSQLVIDQLKKIKGLVQQNEIEKAMELLVNLGHVLDEENKDKSFIYKHFTQFFNSLGSSENFEAVQKIYEFSVEKNYLPPSFYYPCVSSLLARNEVKEAVDFYCKKAKETENLTLYLNIGRKVIELEDSVLLQKLVNTFTEVYDKEFALSTLIYLFATLNKEKEIRKLLDSRHFTMSKKSLSIMANFFTRSKSEEIIQCYLNATSGLSNIYREFFFKKLAKEHIKNDDVPKMKDLLNKIEEEDLILSLNLMEEISDFFKRKGEPAPFEKKIEKVNAL